MPHSLVLFSVRKVHTIHLGAVLPCQPVAIMPPPPSTPGTVRIGGVPEHFNLPFALAAEAGLPSARRSPEVEWVSVPGGSGAMVCIGGGGIDVMRNGSRGGNWY